MAWFDPKTWTAGEVVTASEMNVEVRDNLNFLYDVVRSPIIATHELAAGTDGGTFTSGAWRTRPLNSLKRDGNGIASLSGNQLTLPAGKYTVSAVSPVSNNGSAGEQAGFHKTRLQNITSGSTLVLGGTMGLWGTGAGTNHTNSSLLLGYFELSATSLVELQHRIQNTVTTVGFGAAAGFSVVETYAQIEIKRLGE